MKNYFSLRDIRVYAQQSPTQLRGSWVKHPLFRVFLRIKRHVSATHGPSSGAYDPSTLLHCV
jgi:hypothetical protein